VDYEYAQHLHSGTERGNFMIRCDKLVGLGYFSLGKDQ